MIIGISGKIGSGKDTVGSMIRYFTSARYKNNPENFSYEDFISFDESFGAISDFEIRKYADKLKDIACMLIGCDREDLEDREFKEALLDEQWTYWQNPSDPKDKVAFQGNEYLLNREPTWEKKTHTPRSILQLLGTEAGRQIIHPNIWVNALFADYVPACPSNSTTRWEESNWVITDMRFPNEAQAIKIREGIIIRIERAFDDRVPDLYQDFLNSSNEYQELEHYLKDHGMYEKYYHASETGLDNYDPWDYVIYNIGTIKDLLEEVKQILIAENILDETKQTTTSHI